jgi:hypothetical protein
MSDPDPFDVGDLSVHGRSRMTLGNSDSGTDST